MNEPDIMPWWTYHFCTGKRTRITLNFLHEHFQNRFQHQLIWQIFLKIEFTGNWWMPTVLCNLQCLLTSCRKFSRDAKFDADDEHRASLESTRILRPPQVTSCFLALFSAWAKVYLALLINYKMSIKWYKISAKFYSDEGNFDARSVVDHRWPTEDKAP